MMQKLTLVLLNVSFRSNVNSVRRETANEEIIRECAFCVVILSVERGWFVLFRVLDSPRKKFCEHPFQVKNIITSSSSSF